jgi:hypothetical protein
MLVYRVFWISVKADVKKLIFNITQEVQSTMKQRIIYYVLVILVFSLFSTGLSAKISSRIEGTVSDLDTGEPIEGANVILYKGIEQKEVFITDKKGYFRFDPYQYNPGKEVYHLICTAKGYVPYVPKYYLHAVKTGYENEVFRTFTLQEGQIKHVKINLKKGCQLKGIIYKKELSGETVFKEVQVVLYIKLNNGFFDDQKRYLVEITYTDENGGFKFEGLEPSDAPNVNAYIIKLVKDGYWLSLIENIAVHSNQDNYIDYKVDLTDPTGLKGKINLDGQTLIGGTVQLYSLFGDKDEYLSVIQCEFDESGNYFFKGIKAGNYKLILYAYYAWNQKVVKEVFVEIEKGKTKILDFNLQVEQQK